MKIKRVLQGTALAALAAAAWMGAGSDASAAQTKVDDIIIDYDGWQNINFHSQTEEVNEIIVGIAKVNSKGAKVSAWDVYDDNYAYVDLQKMNVTKDAYIAVKTDKMDKPVFVKIDAAAKKNKVELNAGTRKVTFTSNDKVLDAEKGEYDGYGLEYKDYDDYIHTNYIEANLQYQGATLYFEGRGAGYEENVKDSGYELKKDFKDFTDSKEGKDVTLVTVGKFPTKQVKLNVPKQANGPAIPVDYVKGTIKIKKDVEVRVVGESISATDGSIFVNKTVAVGDFFDKTELEKNKLSSFVKAIGNSDKATLEVRVAAKTDKKGKAASKWTRVAIEKPKAIEVKAVKEDASEVTTSSAVAYTVSGASVELKYTSNKKTGAADKGLILDNKSDYKIDYVVGNTTAPKADDKGKVDGMKTVAKKSVTIKNLSDNQVIWVRIAGNKNEKQWASDWKELITVKIPQAK